MEKTYNSTKLTLSRKAVYTILTVVSAVVLTQIVHAVGVLTGTGAVLGQVLMPMYLPVLILGFIAGPAAGAVAGILSPLVSFAVTSMPSAAMLPFMATELLCFGLFAGLLKNVKINPFLKVLSVMIIGRFVRIAATAAAVYLFNSTAVGFMPTLKIMLAGLPGMLIQLLIVSFAVKNISRSQI